MSVHVAIEHRTTYRFDRPIAIGPHTLRLRPAPHCRTPILAYSLSVEPDKHFINWQQDPFGNHVARLVFPDPADALDVVVDLVADLTVINPFDFFVDEQAERWPFAYDTQLAADLAPYLRADEPGPLVREWLTAEPLDDLSTIDALVALNARLQRDVAYTVRMEPGVQAPEDTLRLALGSCRDTGWLLVDALRQLGVAARFVSGYLVQLALDEAPLDGPAGPTADFTDLHAWAEAYVPGAGWVGLDPTSGLFAGEGHIPLAATPSPRSAAPITGATEPCKVVFEFANAVHRIREDPRVTLPYTDAQWTAIDALGVEVDRRLDAGDVRLTMGGEPTFVSIDDMESPEWTVAADGSAKRAIALDLAGRLQARFAPGALVHHGQGKWYPGEALPRWQITLVWRADGCAVWRDPTLLADLSADGGATADDARALIAEIGELLGIDAAAIHPAWEDPLLALRAGADEGASAPQIRLDPTGTAPAGWAMPLHAVSGGGWATTPWAPNRGFVALLSGDSPLGLRLPLDALFGDDAETHRDSDDDSDRVPTTVLCVERRSGHLHVFLPPLDEVDPALELVAAVEDAAAAVGRPVVVEGYPPPGDSRLRVLGLAPDPGVLEVNVHPAASWRELTAITTGLFADARAARLGTETFQLDGTHSGTGGGNHITIGGRSPADSPVLRRPDLLRSLVTYWQHHPALSYLFAGRFVGPTSQAPRVDEARHESLDELEIAFEQMDVAASGEDAPPPEIGHRLLRHLLVDLTGNTHRAELCIDKLYAPGTERGRLGLVELRGFEMPPHHRMALVQALLVRALVARCWDAPYRGRLVRWGTELHDRFMLPWFVTADIADVLGDLRAHGIAFESSWLAPFLEFRFPRLGVVDVAGAAIELRAAIEPWPVLGEEVGSTAPARYVDSSVERLQVLARGVVAGRHLVTCNGAVVPLRPTSEPGTAVAGVRYKAWDPPSALHPTIGVHTPLVFDLVDTWNSRSLGGCTYHVVHPGGRAYERFPVNASEAEARRVRRFEPHGHTPGAIDTGALEVPGVPSGSGYPLTLDLRHNPRR